MSSQALNSVNYLAPFSETPFGGGGGCPQPSHAQREGAKGGGALQVPWCIGK